MGPKVTPEQIKAIIDAANIDDMKVGEKTTLVIVTLDNGFVLTQSSSCVSAENYDHEIGKSICMKKIEDRIWELEGYALQKQVSSK
jgi:hypothetical protein